MQKPKPGKGFWYLRSKQRKFPLIAQWLAHCCPAEVTLGWVCILKAYAHFSPEWPSRPPGIPCPSPSTMQISLRIKNLFLLQLHHIFKTAHICRLDYSAYHNGDSGVAAGLASISLNFLIYTGCSRVVAQWFQATSFLRFTYLHSSVWLWYLGQTAITGGAWTDPSVLWMQIPSTTALAQSRLSFLKYWH